VVEWGKNYYKNKIIYPEDCWKYHTYRNKLCSQVFLDSPSKQVWALIETNPGWN